MPREPLQLRGGQHLVGVLVLGKRLRLAPSQLLAHRVDAVGQLRLGLGDHVAAEVRDEARRDDRAVLVNDLGVAHDVRELAGHRAREARERGGEDEEPHAAVEIEALDAAQDGEGRVVDHAAPLGVLVGLEIAARPERAHHVGALDAVALRDPVGHDLVDLGRGVAVVGRPLRLELLDEAVVVLEQRLLLRCCAACPHVPPPLTRRRAAQRTAPDSLRPRHLRRVCALYL